MSTTALAMVPRNLVAAHAAAEPSDARLCDAAAARIARPKRAPADSFVLHAPLELLARMALLPLVRPRRPPGRARRDQRARRGLRRGRPRDRGAGAACVREPASARPRICSPRSRPASSPTPTPPRPGSRAHSPPRRWSARSPTTWSRASPRPRTAASSSTTCRASHRAARRSRARCAGWCASSRSSAPGASAGTASADRRVERQRRSGERLLAPPSPGDPGSNFIYPTMHLVEESGLAAELLDAPTRGLDVATASRDLAPRRRVVDAAGRTGARAVRLEPLSHHAAGGARHRARVRRSRRGGRGRGDARARLPRDPRPRPAGPGVPAATRRCTRTPSTASTRRPARPRRGSGTRPTRRCRRWSPSWSTRAALHHDAHLVKYTLACLDAAGADPDAARLFLAAAAFLSAWWRRADGANDGR